MQETTNCLRPKYIEALSLEPPHRLQYGQDPLQFGHLRLPQAPGSHPVLVVIHGGCWKSEIADINFMEDFAESFTQKGIATWNIEYRCIDNPGGGWPGTFQDVGNAIDHLRILAPRYNLDLQKVIVIGHSSGGHLALWSAARHCLPRNSIIYSKDYLPLKGVINLSGPGDLHGFITSQANRCGFDVIPQLIGSTPSNINKRLAQTSPYELLPFGVKQVLVTGESDPAAPPVMLEEYVKKARRLGDTIDFITIKNTAHFELIVPYEEAFRTVEKQVLMLFNS